MKGRSILLALSIALSACRGEPPSSPATTIIVISIDTLRSDHLPSYGYTGVQTPHIDGLRRDSVLFERAYAHVPLTLPSHATMFTGLLPADNGIRDNVGFHLRSDVATVAELLKSQGYATGAAVSAYSLRSSTGISRGFDSWNEDLAPASSNQVMGDVQRSGDKTIATAKEWIRAHSGGQLFYFLHLFEPHSPYNPPEPYRSRYPLAYDGEIARTDELLGDFLQFLKDQKIYDHAAIILLSDHGEGLNDHGEDEHGILLYRESIQVPLMLKFPRADRKNTSIRTPVQLTDVFPTLLALGGVTRKTASSAASLLDVIAERVPATRVIFSETYFPRLHLGWSELHSVIKEKWHLVDGPETQLFDVETDAGEKTDLSSTERRVRAELLAVAKPYIRAADPTTSIDPEEAKKLQALGYLGSAAAGSAEPLPDPKREIAKFRQIRQALWFFQNGRYNDALSATQPLLDSNRRMFEVWDIRARSLAELGRTEEALAAAREAMKIFPADVSLTLLVSDLTFKLGRTDEAEQHARLALSDKPAEAHDILARIALARGDLAGAESEARRALEADRNSPTVAWTLGRIALQRRDHEEALRQFDRALEHIRVNDLSPLRSLHQDRGFVLLMLGRNGEAEAALKEEIRLFPDSETAWENLLKLYRQQRRDRDARDLMRRKSLLPLAGEGAPERAKGRMRVKSEPGTSVHSLPSPGAGAPPSPASGRGVYKKAPARDRGFSSLRCEQNQNRMRYVTRKLRGGWNAARAVLLPKLVRVV